MNILLVGGGKIWLFLFVLRCIVPGVFIPGTALTGGKSTPPPPVPGVIYHGPRNSKQISLTFDACSSRGRGKLDTAVARILVQTRTPATIFLGGKWTRDVARFLRPLASDSLIEFGNHAYLHPHMRNVSGDSIALELRKAQRAIAGVIRKKPDLFRAPYGEVDLRVDSVAESLGLKVIQYSLPSGDPDTLLSEQAIVRYVTSVARGGSIIVMHINGRGRHTAEALPEIIDILRKKGYRFVTVSRLIARETLPEKPRGR